jgi:viroplasmin and RNaseH domain-containing protein
MGDSNVTSTCGPYNLLGGYNLTSSKQIKQTFQLPPHNYVKITANYHFIDFWNGQTGFMKVQYGSGEKYVLWSQSVDSDGMKPGKFGEAMFNICGNSVDES